MSREGNRTRVLLLVKGLGLGGVERLLSRSVHDLDRNTFDYEVCYFTPWKDDVVDEIADAGVVVHCLDVPRDTSLRALTRLHSLLRFGRYDIVHSHSPYPSVLARLLGVMRRPRPVMVHTEHSLPRSRNVVTRTLNRATYPLCDLVISISDDVDQSVHAARSRPRRSTIIRGGVDVDAIRGEADGDDRTRERLGIPAGSRVVGNVAHLRPVKGHSLFLEVAAEVLQVMPDVYFVLVGREKEPGYMNQLKTEAKALGITDHIVFTGFLPNPYPVLQLFDVFLMTSRHEGFPVALVEAMALGIPPVSTNVGGVSEAVADGENGLLAPYGESGILARHVLTVLGDNGLKGRLSHRGQERVREEFDLSQMTKKVEAEYLDLLAN